jgi:hypothetical protein
MRYPRPPPVLEVSAIYVTRDGRVVLGLKSGEGSYVVSAVSGQIEHDLRGGDEIADGGCGISAERLLRSSPMDTIGMALVGGKAARRG